MSFESIVNQSCAFHMASRSDAYFNPVVACRFQTEFRIKSRNSDNFFRSDFRQFANLFQGFFRQIVIFFLNRLQNRNYRFLNSAFLCNNLLHHLTDICRFVHFTLPYFPIQYKLSNPRIRIFPSAKTGAHTVFSPNAGSATN